MVQANAQFVGSIPEKYDTHLGPLFFEHYGKDIARRVRVPASGEILETACGTGISTEFLRAALPEGVEIVATDLSEPMLDYARGKRGGLPNVRFMQANAAELPFDDGAFDAVVCQFGMMFMPDKPATLREARRVLRAGGQIVFNVWDSLEKNPVAKIAHETIGRFFADDPPMFLTVPFGDHEIEPFREMLHGAGFEDLGVDVVGATVECPSARDVASGLVEGNPIIDAIQTRGTTSTEVVVDAVAAALREAFGDAPMRTPLQAIVFTARAAGSA